MNNKEMYIKLKLQALREKWKVASREDRPTIERQAKLLKMALNAPEKDNDYEEVKNIFK